MTSTRGATSHDDAPQSVAGAPEPSRPWDNPRPLSQRIAPVFFGLAIGCVIVGVIQVNKQRARQQQQAAPAALPESEPAGDAEGPEAGRHGDPAGNQDEAAEGR